MSSESLPRCPDGEELGPQQHEWLWKQVSSSPSWAFRWLQPCWHCYRTKFCVLDAQWGQINWDTGVWTKERLIAAPSKENRRPVLKTPELPDGLGGDGFIGKISTVYMYLIFFIHSSVYGHLGCFHVQGCNIISSPYFWVHSLPSLIKDGICTLELREDQGGWSLFLTNKKWRTQKGFVPGRPTGSCLVSTSWLQLQERPQVTTTHHP